MYRGSSKHKNRPANDLKGTLCPEWSHATPGGGLAYKIDVHDWEKTPATKLFEEADIDSKTGRRYATQKGIAFEAKETGDGTWHGFPIPWESVPAVIKARWQALKLVTRRQVKVVYDKNDIFWPLQTDD
jgi:hypothetical protein